MWRAFMTVILMATSLISAKTVFKKRMDLDNKIFSNTKIASKTVSDVYKCIEACSLNNTCLSVIYSPSSATCRLYAVSADNATPISDQGATVFERDQDLVSDDCSSVDLLPITTTTTTSTTTTTTTTAATTTTTKTTVSINGPVSLTYCTDKKLWPAAQTYCQDIGGQLVTMATAQKVLDVKSYLNGIGVTGSSTDYIIWVGLRRVDGVFTWVNGQSVEEFTTWIPGRPKTYDCVFLNLAKDGLVDISCTFSLSRSFLCELPA